MKSMLLLLSLGLVLIPQQESLANANERPNIVLAISDDQSFPHASAYGCKGVSTPSFDEIAQQVYCFTMLMLVHPDAVLLVLRC